MKKRVMFLAAIVCGSAVITVAAATMAEPGPATQPVGQEGAESFASGKVRLDTPSGYPVPRFVSLKASRTNCRQGPSFDHPVRITFMRQGLPVIVVAETQDHWRKVRDFEGDECWVHKSKLSGVETALVQTEGLVLRVRPTYAAPQKARLGKGLIAKVEKHKSGWVKVSVDGVRGWVQPSGLWGKLSPSD